MPCKGHYSSFDKLGKRKQKAQNNVKDLTQISGKFMTDPPIWVEGDDGTMTPEEFVQNLLGCPLGVPEPPGLLEDGGMSPFWNNSVPDDEAFKPCKETFKPTMTYDKDNIFCYMQDVSDVEPGPSIGDYHMQDSFDVYQDTSDYYMQDVSDVEPGPSISDTFEDFPYVTDEWNWGQ
jgi:hypothetical protein